MNRTIWKTVLAPTGKQSIAVPVGAEFLCAREQHGTICVWYRCDPYALKEDRPVVVVGTGHEAPHDGIYLGTASLGGGALIFHVFVWPR